MKPLLVKAHAIYAIYKTALERGGDVFLLILRAYFGYRFIKTGLGKFENFDSVVEFFTSLQIPYPYLNAAAAASVEVLGGALLILGLGSRLITVPLTVTMLVAYVTAHSKSLSVFWDNPSVFFRQEPFPFLIATLVVLFFGAGRFSIDAFIGRRALREN